MPAPSDLCVAQNATLCKRRFLSCVRLKISVFGRLCNGFSSKLQREDEFRYEMRVFMGWEGR